MASSEQLRQNKEQHKPKNKKSKKDDKIINKAIYRVIEELEYKYPPKDNIFGEYKLDFQKSLSNKEMIDFLKDNSSRQEFDYYYIDRGIKPDGGVLWLVKTNFKGEEERLPLLFAEVKRQGTNDSREEEGKKRQAIGNAIERLGKNLIAIRTMMICKDITPFICFGAGCDFVEPTALSKVSAMNSFYPLNKVYVYQKDNCQPVSMFFRKEDWSEEEMYKIMYEIALVSFTYYMA